MTEDAQRKTRTLGGEQTLTTDAANWLKNNMGIDIDNMDNASPKRPVRSESVRNFNSVNLTADKLNRLESTQKKTKRPQSAHNNSAFNSRASSAILSQTQNLPDASQSELKAIAMIIHSNQNRIAESVFGKPGVNLREVLPSTKLVKLMRLAGVNLNVIQVKQWLRELGFAFSGPSVSMLGLLQATKAYVMGLKKPKFGDEEESDDAISLFSAKKAII